MRRGCSSIIRYFNEINNIYFDFLSSGMTADDLPSVMQAAHHQFIASALAVKLGHQINLDFWIGAMLAASRCAVYPQACAPEDVQKAWEQACGQYFFADVQCKGYDSSYQLKYFGRKGIRIRMKPGDETILREGTVDFLSLSYYRSMITSSEKKRAVIRCSLGRLIHI